MPHRLHAVNDARNQLHPRAVLIGPMAAGKTKLGKRVATLLGATFLDTDKMIVAEHGDIPSIFAERGEEEFRRIEREVVARALHSDGIVSLGGGAILSEATQEDLRVLPVVYLHITPEAVLARLNTATRPLLADGIDAWTRIFDARKPIYESLASVSFDTSSLHLADLANTVAAWIRDQEQDND